MTQRVMWNWELKESTHHCWHQSWGMDDGSGGINGNDKKCEGDEFFSF